MSDSWRPRLEGFLIGISVCTLTYWLAFRRKKPIDDKSTKAIADDSCQSLYYDFTPSNEGKGFPYPGTIPYDIVGKLVKSHRDYKLLPTELYKAVVENLPVCCVDIICQRGE